jgi:hypothetical protein
VLCRCTATCRPGSYYLFPTRGSAFVEGPCHLSQQRNLTCQVRNTCLNPALQTSYSVLQYHRSGVLPFLFQHGHFSEACRLFLAHLPPPPLPPAPTPGAAPQRAVASPVDPLVSEYGSLEEVCELCVTYGAMPVLEKAVQERGEARGGEWAGQQAAVLAKMAAFCETHRHFHHLYRIQVSGKP